MTLAPSRNADVRAGAWGGTQAVLRVPADAPAELDLSCAHASIEPPFTVDAEGRFQWSGRFVQERPGPTREDEGGGTPAVFRGTVEGDRLTLTVLIEGRVAAGPFTLEFGKQARVTKCA